MADESLFWSDALTHIIMHAAQSQIRDGEYFIPAHVATYNPGNNTITCVLPHSYSPLADECAVLHDIPLLSPMVGAGYGLQYAPFGGATQADPTAGEQVWLHIIAKNDDSYIAGAYAWTNKQPVANPNLKAGELFISDYYGNQVYLQSGGTVLVSGASSIIVEGGTSVLVSGGNSVVVETGGEVQVNAPTVQIGNLAETLYPLVTQVFQTLFNEHTHPVGGGNTGVPNQQMTDAQLTSVVKGN